MCIVQDCRSIDFLKILLMMGARQWEASFARLLGEIVHLAKKFVAGGGKTKCRPIRETHQFQRVFKKATFYVFIRDFADGDLSIDPFEVQGTVIVRNGMNGYPDGDKRLFVIAIVIQEGFHLPVGLLLPVDGEQAVTVPIEKEYAYKQYGS
jgi:hypothetical protein